MVDEPQLCTNVALCTSAKKFTVCDLDFVSAKDI